MTDWAAAGQIPWSRTVDRGCPQARTHRCVGHRASQDALIVLDAYAVLALLKGEPATQEVREFLTDAEDARLTALGVFEVVDHLVRLAGACEDEAALDLVQLGLADAEPLDADLALRAGLLRARHYDRRTRAVSLADCVAAETARAHDASVASADPHLLDLCGDVGIGVIPLPDSAGNTWAVTTVPRQTSPAGRFRSCGPRGMPRLLHDP